MKTNPLEPREEAMNIKSAFRGWFGEKMTSLINWAFLDGKVYRQLNNVTLQLENGSTTQIDHLIVSKFGIFVLETKNMSGWIFGDEKDRQWTQSFPNGKKFRFQNPIRQNYRHLMAVIEFLQKRQPDIGLTREDIEKKLFSVIFFGPDAEIKTPERLPDSAVVGPVRYILSKTDSVFSESQVDAICTDLKSGKLPNGMLSGIATRKKHVDSLKERHDLGAGSPCPRCGKELITRKRKKDGAEFLGCSGFPTCRFIKT